MLKHQTVFVIGAGASKEFGLPIGAELAIKISEKLNVIFDQHGRNVISGDKDLFFNVTKLHGQELLQYQKAAWLIRDGIILAHSIDDFLDVHQHDERVVTYGKAAIAKCILEAESKSTLFFERFAQQLQPGPRTIAFKSCADTWLVGLMRLLVRKTPHADRAKVFDRCTFIIFNYDRCVEHFFLHALQRFYDISEEEAVGIVAKARIYHPYGLAGELSDASSIRSAPFGEGRADFCAIGNTMLKTYTETVDSEEIRAAVAAAQTIVFLGFAFHDQNMSLLAHDLSLDIKRVIGTAFGLSESDIRVIGRQMVQWVQSNLRLMMPENIDIRSNLKAVDVFSFYSKTL